MPPIPVFLALARRQRRREMIEFLMPTNTMIFLTMAVLMAAMLIVLRWLG
jgi:hypothetical protein